MNTLLYRQLLVALTMAAVLALTGCSQRDEPAVAAAEADVVLATPDTSLFDDSIDPYEPHRRRLDAARRHVAASRPDSAAGEMERAARELRVRAQAAGGGESTRVCRRPDYVSAASVT
ncbi:hypothetical protein RQM47_16980 [Rubrivirga sp. S365]|uniref:hypothetical protein n=1 Tax=Rubrivirga sp. S365 TaxID=3076080 RepID=UPI0028C9D9E4|nr:hypothetical protein [Rubrivirga sp. S365]MDT7858346.1 hypothetical protein [Rubrivirga sp. S365]